MDNYTKAWNNYVLWNLDNLKKMTVFWQNAYIRPQPDFTFKPLNMWVWTPQRVKQ